MAWARLDDRLPHHRKVRGLGRDAMAAFGLHTAALCFCQHYETDGRILETDLPLVLPAMPKPRPAWITALVRVGLWDEDKAGGWWIHDFLAFYPSAAQRQAMRQEDSKRKKARFQPGLQPDSGRNPNGFQPDSSRIPPGIPHARAQKTETKTDTETKPRKAGGRPTAPSGPLPPWVAELPFPPPLPGADWWAKMRALYPTLDQETVARDAAAYWLAHPGKYRAVAPYLARQFQRAWARRREQDAAGDPLPRYLADTDFTPDGDVTPAARAREAARLAGRGA